MCSWGYLLYVKSERRNDWFSVLCCVVLQPSSGDGGLCKKIMRTLEGPACQAFPGKSLPLSGCALPDVQNPNFPQEDMFGG